MVREDQVVIYKQYAAKGQFRIAVETALDLPAEFNAVFEPLELIFNPEDGRLVLVAKVGTSIDGQKAQVAFFSIDYTELFAEMTTSYSLMNFADTYRTKSHVILNLPDGDTHLVLDPFSTQEPNIELYNRILAPSINDDFLFDFKASMVSTTDLSAGRDRQPFMGVPEGCSLLRPRESEQASQARALDAITLTLDCLDKFEVITGAQKNVYSSEAVQKDHGRLVNAFATPGSTAQVMLLFQDLSLHYLDKGKRLWTREEALSQIVQVEIFDPSSIPRSGADLEGLTLQYLRKMSEPVSFAQVPFRIIERYVQNFNFLVESATSLISGLAASDNIVETLTAQGTDLFGFEKTLVLRTKPNKVIAISSLDGSIQWTFFDKANIEKVFVEQRSGPGGQVSVMLVLEDRLVSLDPLTGQVASSEPLPASALPTSQMDFIMVRQQKDAALLAVPKSGEGQVSVLQNGFAPGSLDTSPLFFTSVDQVNGRINGHRINTKTMTAENTWKISLGEQNPVVDVRTQYETASAAAHIESILPTAFG